MRIQNGLNNFLKKKLSPKQFIFGVCLIPLPVVVVLFGILWLYDPLQLFISLFLERQPFLAICDWLQEGLLGIMILIR